MAENNKPKQGKMSASNMIYYSTTLPKDSDAAKMMHELWNEEDDDLFSKVLNKKGNSDDTWAAQKRLVELGYLEPHLLDGYRGPITDGAIRRYQYNTDGPGGMYRLQKAMDDAGDRLWKGLWGE